MASTVDLVNQSNGDLSEDKEKKTFKDLSLREKLAYLKKVNSVEPLLASYLVAAVICLPALLTLELEKACRSNLRQNETVCTAIRESQHDNYTELNEEITILLSNIHSWQVPCQNIAPLILVLFIGSFSDRHKIRKPFMILPLLGELFAVTGCIISVIFMEELPVEIHGFLQTVVPSFFGGSTMLIMAVFSYVADTSSVEMRTFRVAVVQTVLNVALPIGQFLSGILFIHLDYIGVLLIAACFYVFGIMYGIFCLNEKISLDFSQRKNICSDMFDPTNAIDTVRILVTTKKGKKKNLLYLWNILLMFFIVTGVTNVDFTTLFLYLQNTFKWTSPDFSYYASTNTIVHLFGIILFVPLFTKIFNLSDVTILIFTFLDKIVTTIIIGLAKSTIVLYIACFVSIITNITIIALRSMATKVVSEDDLGKAQSLFGICEAIGIALLTPAFNLVFVNTLKDFPSAFIFCESLAYGACFLIAFFFYFQSNDGIESKDVEITIEDKNQTKKPENIQITHI